MNNITSVLEEGKYQLVISNNSCTTKSEIVVKDLQPNVKIITDRTEFVPGDVFEAEANVLSENPENVSYAWFPTGIASSPSLYKTMISPSETVLLKVNITTKEGCKGRDSLLLKKKEQLFIPNALAPGGTDINSFWGIKGTESYPDIDVKVFNRWGNLVYEQKGYSTPWDGTNNGKALPSGTYYYVIKHPKLEGPKVGDLTIVRY